MNADLSHPHRHWWWHALAVLLMFGGLACFLWLGIGSIAGPVVGVLLMVAGMASQVVARRHAPGSRKVDRRYANEFFIAMASYVVIVLLVWPQVEHVHALWLKVIIAVLPVVPTLFVARALVRRIRSGDELEHRMFLEAAAIAGLVVGLVTFCLGFLQAATVLPDMHGELLLVLPFMCVAWGGALWWARHRYR